ncbi:pantoate--beta-alanine ligase [Rickettsiales bacterium]|nr:pantoate--beta-alanine ligase [Rickettsiales bacterium]
MKITRNQSELDNALKEMRKNGKIIGFVPTMGALHDGHLSLIKKAKKEADIVVVSIFVNPTQFSANEDLDKYPRTEESDIEKLSDQKADIVYLPSKEDIYPENFSTKISTGKIGQDLEGISRPHFFDGVALIVTKLFMQVRPDIAIFGEKDYQQLHIIKNLVRDLNMPIKIIGGQIIREKNGLAMSSRNKYLSDSSLEKASYIYKTILKAKELLESGESEKKVTSWAESELLKQGFEKVDYLQIRDNETLLPLSNETKEKRLLVAAYLDGVRLIDNIQL